MINKKIINNSNLSIFIAVCAFGLSLWQGYQQRVQNHISVEPRINAYFKHDSKIDKHGIYIFNNGLGPAFIKSFEVTLAGKKLKKSVYGELYSAAIKLNLDPTCFAYGSPRKGDSLALNKEETLMEVSKNASKSCADSIERFNKIRSKPLNFTIKFESIYGDRFVYKYLDNKQYDD
ncbi:hypothetical protein [Cobetia sp. QF-1]|uniref:hypothetical protein n=1 Tax=Cobetia sp. QF-1 TaxID=1969833 RepID=UPI000B54261A|nr:hypothetical protein [Cobetia sp. QF-1]